MSNNKLLVNERQRDLGNFMVGRLLPFRHKRQVGPFTFIDHMGPSQLGNGIYFDVDQHPHIGLSTLTYLYEGEIEHKDSMGSSQVIRPGDVGFMTAGNGVTHTERTPAHLRNSAFKMHGYQIWVALPEDKAEMSPQFEFYTKEQIPHWTQDDVELRLVAGNAFGKSSPLQGFSELFMIDVHTKSKRTLDLSGQLEGEVAFVIVNGSIKADAETVSAGQMLISKTGCQCSISMDADTQLLIFGGQPLKSEPILLWNFVAHSKERLKQAKADWINKQFPTVPNDTSYIPFPKAIT